MAVRMVVSSSREVATFRARLENPEPALRAVGALMVAASQLAFRQQRLGDIKWPERYPNQQEPFINIAGMLADLGQGSAIKERRFQRRPALIDRGQLRDSITFAATSKSVRVGSSKDYAAAISDSASGSAAKEFTKLTRRLRSFGQLIDRHVAFWRDAVDRPFEPSL